MSRSGQTSTPTLSPLAGWLERYHSLQDRARQLARDLEALGVPPRPTTAEDEAALLTWRRSIGLPDHAGDEAALTRAAVNAAGMYQGVGQVAGVVLRRIVPAAEQIVGTCRSVIRAADFSAGGTYLDRRTNQRFAYGELASLPADHPLRQRIAPEDAVEGRLVVLGPARWSPWHGAHRPHDWYTLSEVVETTLAFRKQEIEQAEDARRWQQEQAEAARRKQDDTPEGMRRRIAALEAQLGQRGGTTS